MNEAQSIVLARWKSMLDYDREVLATWAERKYRFRSNGVDTTAEVKAMLADRIARLEALIAKVDHA